jgi:hypothetical protein
MLMKKNLTLAVILFIGLVAFMSSCVKDTFTELDAYSEQRKNEQLQDSIAKSQAELEAQLAKEQAEFEAGLTEQQILLLDSLKKIGGTINYSVSVVSASESAWWSSYFAHWGSSKGENSEKGVTGATVTIAQNGVLYTATTDASGIAQFKDLRIGTINVNVQKTDFTTVDFVVELPALTEAFHSSVYDEYYDSYIVTDSTTHNIVDLVRHVATMVPVFSLTSNLSTISGIATVETDLTNNAPEPAAGVKIMGIIDVFDEDFWALYIYQPETYEWWNCSTCSMNTRFDYYGKIKQIAFSSVVSTATTAADGTFTLQVPSTPQGLPIHIEYDEFALNQTLLLPTLNGVPVWGPQTVRTIYGNGSTPTAIPGLGLLAANVQSAYVTIGAPTGTANAQPTTVATATAVLSSSGIASISMNSQGSGYTQAPIVKIAKGTVENSVQAEGTAVISGGKVTGVTITSAGTGYKPADAPAITFVGSDSVKAMYTPEFTYSVANIVLTGPGSGYGSTAPAVSIVGAGTGATASAIMGADINTVDLTAPGSGYTQAPLVTISDNFKAWDGATANMTTENPILSITYNGTNAQLWPAAPLPTVTVGGAGAGATATATLATVGKVQSITALVGGTGYTSAPEVTFSGGGGFGATATASIGAGAVTAITITNPGQGYTSVPTITLTGGAGSGASATAVLGFPVTSITLGTAGVNYQSGTTTITLDNGGPIPAGPVSYTATCDIKYNRSVSSITLTNTAGNVFSAVPTVTFTSRDGLGTGAAATATVKWAIIDIVVNNQGSGYKSKIEPTSVIIAPPGGAGVQATATARLGNGKLAAVRVVNQGEGYTAAPNVFISVGGGGVIPVKQAELSATVAGGHVTGLTIVDPGEGYDLATDNLNAYTIQITTFHTGAAATAKVNPLSGTIDYIQITAPGAGYSVVPAVEIVNTANPADANGFGTGAAATAVITDGRVSAINVTNAGSGYYIAPTVTIVVPTTLQNAVAMCTVSGDGRITAVTFPAFDPYTKGYGYNAVPTVTFMPSVTGVGSGATGVAILKDGRVDNIVITNQGSGYIGKNRPASAQGSPGAGSVSATAGKSYIRDVHFGTGVRTVN